MTERSEVSWGTTTIPYEVRRSSRRATLSLAVEPGTGLLVTAPARTPIAKLDALVRSRGLWITKRLREPTADTTPKELVSGESFLYLGRQHLLRVRRGDDVAPIRLRAGRLHLAIPPSLAKGHEPAYARAAMVDWYRGRAAEYVPAPLDRFAAKLGVQPSGVLIADAAKRWGSCSAGVIRINWRVMQAPKPLIDYVLAHEAVHLVHEHHGPKFWATLVRLMPDYEVRRARLRELGPRLVW